MNPRVVKHLVLSLLALFFLYGCSKDEGPEAACILPTPSEVFAGETITLQSCNQNAIEYSWSVLGPGSVSYANLKGQMVDYSPTEVGNYTITLFVTTSKGQSNKSVKITVKASGNLISEGMNTFIQFVNGFQKPNGNFVIFGRLVTQGSSFENQWELSNNLQRLSSSPTKTLIGDSYYSEKKLLTTAEGVLLCARNGSRSLDTYLIDLDGKLIWNKNGFPSFYSPTQRYPFVLIKDLINGSVLGESYSFSGSDMNESYVHNVQGQGISWTTKIQHTANAVIRDIVIANNQYVVLSVDPNASRSFIDVLDSKGAIVSQKELTITLKESLPSYEESKILFVDGKFVITVINANTSIYWLDQNFNIEKIVAIKDVRVTHTIYKTSFGYILFGHSFTMVRLDNQGNILSNGTFGNAELNQVIPESNGNYVLIGTSQEGVSSNEITQKMKVIRVSPDGKVIQ